MWLIRTCLQTEHRPALIINNMARERAVEAFILKRQDYGEADQIITLFSKEEGKIRALVKAANLPTSKLRPVLQPLFQTRITLSGSSSSPGLSKVIGVQPITVYSGVLEDHNKLSVWYIASELLIRALPDSAPNELLFSEWEQFAQFLHNTELELVGIKKAITQFQIKAMAALGLGVRAYGNKQETNNLQFSLDRGGFIYDDALDGTRTTEQIYVAFQQLSSGDYQTGQSILDKDATELEKLINRFVAYQLEREIKSQRQF